MTKALSSTGMMPAVPQGIVRAAVIGAGSMGAGIAAQFANAGVAVDLLDIAGPPGAARNAPALAGIERQRKTNGFMNADAADLVRPGNIEDDLSRLGEADWIVEAVVESLDVKRALFAKVEQHRKDGSIVSSNTSTIPRAELVAGQSARFDADFVITHFFNPPRTMELVEFVTGPRQKADGVAKARGAAETVLGKTIVDCRDTPGFIANRIGCYWLAVAVIEAQRHGLSAEQADAVMGVFGTPKTGAFGLLDLIGVDMIPSIWGSLAAALPPDDDIHAYDLPASPLIVSMIEAGQLGRKAKGGFYRVDADRRREALDLERRQYRPERPCPKASLPGGGDLIGLLDDESNLGRYAWTVFSRLIAYAARHAPEIAGDIGAIDAAIALGYAWRHPPFRLADLYGATRIAARLEAGGLQVPGLIEIAAARGGFHDTNGQVLASTGGRSVTPANAITSLATFKIGAAPIAENSDASLWNLGAGIACLELHTKMNSIGPHAFAMIETALQRGGHDFNALVIGNDDARAFSAGADLNLLLGLIDKQDWSGLTALIEQGQTLLLGLKYAEFPVVGAVRGLALGGGCEVLLHCDAIVAHAETNAGLPEAKVGLLPGWGGHAQMLIREQQSVGGVRGPAATAARAFGTIRSGTVFTSALQARDALILRPVDQLLMHRDHVFAAARQTAATLAEAYRAPERAMLAVAGPSAKAGLMQPIHGARKAGQISDNDVAVADAIAEVLSGGANGEATRPMSEAELHALERATFIELARRPATPERIRHMLATGKPLRN